MNKTLFNIKEDAIELYNQLDEANGEITPELEIALKINESELKTKSVNYAGLIKSLDSESKIIKDEIKRLQALIKRNDNVVLHLKTNLSDALFTYQIDEIKTELVKINFRKSESVEITCEVQDLPEDCKVIKVEPISKTELKKQLKGGRIIDGVELKTNLNLQIK